jgi:hypothetical protein
MNGMDYMGEQYDNNTDDR